MLCTHDVFGTSLSKRRWKVPQPTLGHSSCADMHVLIKYIIKHSSYWTSTISSGKLLLALRLSPCTAFKPSLWFSPTRCLQEYTWHLSLLTHHNLNLRLAFTVVPQPQSISWSPLLHYFMMLCHKFIFSQLHVILQIFLA